MNILMINCGAVGSTGNIMKGIAIEAQKRKHGVFIAVPDNRKYRAKDNLKGFNNTHIIGGLAYKKIGYELGRITGFDGCFNIISTIKLCSYIKKNRIDVIHMHNLHSGFLNLAIFFRFIKKYDIPAVWTLHDCWAFTGHCPYFDLCNCRKWENGCYKCPSYKNYPASIFDNSRRMWLLKKKWFTGVHDLTIVTPSVWLSDLVKKSYLSSYPVQVINNGIDLSVFHPINNNIRKKYGIDEGKKIILGVAFGWERRKGLDVFIELSKRLETEQYQIILVGTDEKIDLRLPSSIISIHSTQNQSELAEIYSSANLFVNPTREDNYPTVNMEAIACGTPVLTFDTGGSPEIVDSFSGESVYDDIDELEKKIRFIVSSEKYKLDGCLERAKKFNRSDRFREYVSLIETCSKRKNY